MSLRSLSVFLAAGFLCSKALLGAGVPSNGSAVAEAKGDAVRCVSLPCTKSGEARNLWIAQTKAKLPSAVLVLLPNGDLDPKKLLADPAWQNFAEDHELGLAAITVAGKPTAGQPPPVVSELKPASVVLHAMDHEYGGGIPLVLYGWPQQADFTAGLLAENPKRVLGWCLRLPSHLPVARGAMPPGIIVCQKENKPLYDALMADFTAGRKRGEYLTWIALAGENPASSSLPELDSFVRKYLAAQFAYKLGLEQWMNLDTKGAIATLEANAHPAVASYLPQPMLTAAWAALHVPGGPAVAQQAIVEREEDTHNRAQPKLHLYLRRPAGNTKIEGVFAYCTWDKDREKILKRLQDEHYFLVRYADEHHLALLTWSTAIAFDNAQSADERSQQENFKDNSGFNQLADAWERGVHVLCHDAGLPENNFLLYGLSAGAQWAHRLALRKPGHFLAVNIHVNSSYDWPTPEAKSILWLQTTGEREYGYQAALRFYARARDLGYPIIFKAGENLGHASSPQIEEIARRFFDYALTVKAKRDELLDRADRVAGRQAKLPDLYTLSGLEQAPYYADLINQEVYAADAKDMIPVGQRVPLPSKTLAQAWGEIMDAPGLSLVSNPAGATTPASAAPPLTADKGKVAAAVSAGERFQPKMENGTPVSGPMANGSEAAATPSNNNPNFEEKIRLSVQRSIAQHPELAQAGSALNTAFVDAYYRLQAAEDPLLRDPTWPEQILRIVRDQKGVPASFQREFQASVQRAVELYPALAQADNPLNAAFLSEYRRLKEGGSNVLANPTWPEQVARTVGEKPADQ